VDPTDDDLAAGRPLHDQEQLEQGTLAGAGMPRHEHHLAGVDAEGDVVQRVARRTVVLADLAEVDQRAARPAQRASSIMASTKGSATATSMPPRAVPSSFDTHRPVSGTWQEKCSICDRTFWPLPASTVSHTSWGASGSRRRITRTTLASCSIRSALTCCRPAE